MSYTNPKPIKMLDRAPKKNKDGSYTSIGLNIESKGTIDTDKILDVLMDIADPEIEVNLVDLGLVYAINVAEDNAIRIDMTLTNAACPLTDTIANDVKTSLSHLSDKVDVNWVWVPAWNPKRITEEGQLQLQALGVRF